MEQDQVKTQDQVSAAEVKNVETNQEQADQQVQEPKKDDNLEKAIAEIEAKYKAQIAGLDKKVSDYQKQLTEKEREKLSETERAKAELEDIKAEREQAERERNELRKKRIIDNALYSEGLPTDLFEDWITGETEEDIKADVAKKNAYIQEHIDREVERKTKELLKGKDPGRQDTENLGERDRLIAQYNEAEKKGDSALMMVLKERISKLPK